MNVSEIAVRRPVFTVMVTLAILVLGLVGFQRLGSDLYPDVTFPAVVVSVAYPGASPSEVEALVVEPLEDAVSSLNGLRRVRSFSRGNSGMLFVLFELGVDLAQSADEVRERVAQVRHKLPTGVEEPVVARFDVGAAPVLTYTLRGSGTLPELHEYAESVIQPSLERVDGVAAVEVKGGATRELKVDLDRVKLDALGLAPTQIVQRLRAENLSVPGGHFEDGQQEVSVRTLAEFQSVEHVRDTIVATAHDGSAVRLRDIAVVTDGFAELRTRARVNGTDAVTVEVRKLSGTNTVTVADRVKQRMAALEVDFPEGVSSTLIVDAAHIIELQVKQVEEDIVFGGLMAILVIFFFMLDVRSTLISALALPTSVIGTFFVMYVLGYTLNMMTLLALSLAIGLLIDDAVVVRESIFKHLEMGKPPRLAALDGTKEVALSVVTTTATILAVFIPIAFVEGMVGQFFREFGITICVAVVISTFVAFTLDPMLSSRFSRSVRQGSGSALHELRRPFEWMHRQSELTYRAILDWSVGHKWTVGLLALGSLVLMAYVGQLTGQEFMSSEDRAQFVMEVELPAGTTLAENARLTRQVESEMLEHPEFRVVLATIGQGDQTNKTQWRIVTSSMAERSASLAELKAVAREAASKLPNTRVSVTDPPLVEGASTEAPIMINVQGDDYSVVKDCAAEIAQILRATPGVGDVQVRHSPGRPELSVRVNRERAAGLGVSAADVALTLRTAVEGELAGKLRQHGGNKDVPIRVRLDEVYRAKPDALNDLTVVGTRGDVKLGEVVDILRTEGPQVIERLNRRRVITIWATPLNRPLGDVAKEFQPAIAALEKPVGVTVSYDGQLNSMKENKENMSLAFLLGIAFIYMVLASEFESFLHPLTIMLTLPLALVGAILALFLSKSTLAMGALIGIILLMGLVTKNAILLIDRVIVRVRVDMQSPLQAVLAAGPERLRPILMTSAAMVLGMLPTAIGGAEGSEFRAPMAIAVIGGVVSSTLLSLVVVPVFYLVVEDLKAFVLNLGASETARRRQANVSAIDAR